MLQRMRVQPGRMGTLEDTASSGGFVGGAMYQQQVLIRLDRDFVVQDAVLGDTDAEQARADGAYTTHQNGILERADDPGLLKGPATSIGPTPGTMKKGGSKKSMPQIPPQKAPALPQCLMWSPVL